MSASGPSPAERVSSQRSARSAIAAIDRWFGIRDRGSSVGTELAAGATTFLAMSYIVFVQPSVLSGRMFGIETGLDFGAVTTATCLSAALASALMGLWARAPIAQAPGMGENFFLVLTLIPAAAAAGYPEPWRVALGVVFASGVLFLLLSLGGLRQALVESISPSLRAGISSGIGIFIAFIGLSGAGVIVKDPGTAVRLSSSWLSPEIAVFFAGLALTTALRARRVPGSILIGIAGSALVAFALRAILTPQAQQPLAALALPATPLAWPPSLAPTFLAMDLSSALSLAMLPFVLVFLLMDLFDTVGTLVGVSEGAGLERRGLLPEPGRAYLSDAVGTVAGAALGTSTVTSFLESAAGVAQGGRTGLVAVTVGALFLLSIFAAPLVGMIGSYSPITAPALVVVGCMMIPNVARVDVRDPSEAIPALLIAIGIPLSFSISDGLALGFVVYAVVKLLSGRARELRWPMWLAAAAMLAYLTVLRAG